MRNIAFCTLYSVWGDDLHNKIWDEILFQFVFYDGHFFPKKYSLNVEGHSKYERSFLYLTYNFVPPP